MKSSEKAYREIIGLIDNVVAGTPNSDAITSPAVSPRPQGLLSPGLPPSLLDTKQQQKKLEIVAPDEPRRLSNGQIYDPLMSDSGKQPSAVSHDGSERLITMTGEWRHEDKTAPNGCHQLEIFAELSTATRRGKLILNGLQFEI